MDIVTVHHNERNFEQAVEVDKALLEFEGDRTTFNLVDNSINNRGFSRACNLGAARGDEPYIGFLNPDVIIEGPFIEQVLDVFENNPDVAITGSNHGKPASDIRAWGLRNWVCGCTMFVRREWFEGVGGFDERYEWSFEDTDLCRQAESQGMEVKPIDLPIRHESPDEDSPRDAKYKRHNFDISAGLYFGKWR